MRLQRFALASGLALAAALGGCGDTKTGTMLVSPSRFMLYNCNELVVQQTATVARLRQLEDLIARAKRDSGGSLVSAVSYEPEYQNALGELKVLRQQAAQKDCTLPDPNAQPASTTAAPQPQAKPARRKR
ncbi:hypothetical protein MXD81_43085 [Microbacteriaceae bacterium K1510]|nr:hypothetical protein [Microbacteriaceae bacterium K1510]